MRPFHSLLKRQLRRAFDTYENIPAEWQGFIAAVNDAYFQADDDRRMLERSIDISSQELNQSNSELRAIFSALPDVLFRLDRAGRILDYKAGAHSVLQYPPERFIGKLIQSLPGEGVGATYAAALARIHATRQIVQFEHPLTLKGYTYFFEARLLPLSLPQEEQVIALVCDITQRKQAEAKLRQVSTELEHKLNTRTAELAQSNDRLHKQIIECRQTEWVLQANHDSVQQSLTMEALERLAGGLAQDLEKSLASLVHDDWEPLQAAAGDDLLRAQLAEIKQSAARARQLTQRLKAFSRRQTLQPKVLNLNDVIRESSAALASAAGPDIKIINRLHEKLWPVKADPVQVTEVLLALAVQARAAMPRGGQLTVTTNNVVWGQPAAAPDALKPGSYTTLSLADTGQGIDPETLPHIFEPFFLSSETDRPESGLSLASVHGIVKQSGGHITAKSHPERGNIFTIYLPHCRDAITATTQVKEETERTMPSQVTILLVDDEPAVRALTSEILVMNDYRVLEAANGTQALEICAAHPGPIAMLVTDLVMPQMNGRILAECVRNLRPDIKVIFMSGYTDDTVMHNNKLDNLTSTFIQKPFSPFALLDRVQQMLAAIPPVLSGVS